MEKKERVLTPCQKKAIENGYLALEDMDKIDKFVEENIILDIENVELTQEMIDAMENGDFLNFEKMMADFEKLK